MAGWWNVGSLVFGLAAWVLPVIGILRQKEATRFHPCLDYAVSIGACAISLSMQILYTNHLVRIEDWTALLDTSDAVAALSVLLVFGTFALNGIALALRKGSK